MLQGFFQKEGRVDGGRGGEGGRGREEVSSNLRNRGGHPSKFKYLTLSA